MSEKIQKVLANTGVGSRREIETWIKSGRVTINTRTATIGDRMTYHDQVYIDGREIKLIKSNSQQPRVLLYHKQEGEMCTRKDPKGRPTIYEHLPLLRNGRWISIGRLDFNTSGLLLMTNNGALANHLMHPSANIEREYAVRIRGIVTKEIVKKLQQGVQLKDSIAHFDQIVDAGGSGSNHWYHVIVKEGKNRLVRRIWEALGFTVSRLIRIRYGSIRLPPGLRKTRYVELTWKDTRVTLGSDCPLWHQQMMRANPANPE